MRKELFELAYNGDFVVSNKDYCKICHKKKIGVSLLGEGNDTHICKSCLGEYHNLTVGEKIIIGNIEILKIAHFKTISDELKKLSGFYIRPEDFHDCKMCSNPSDFLIDFGDNSDGGWEYGICSGCLDAMYL